MTLARRAHRAPAVAWRGGDSRCRGRPASAVACGAPVRSVPTTVPADSPDSLAAGTVRCYRDAMTIALVLVAA